MAHLNPGPSRRLKRQTAPLSPHAGVRHDIVCTGTAQLMEINDIAVIVIALGQIIGRSGLLIPGMEIGSVTQIYTVSQRIVSTLHS